MDLVDDTIDPAYYIEDCRITGCSPTRYFITKGILGVFQEIAQKAMQTAPRKCWLDRTIENRLMTYEAWFSLARYNLYEMVNPILFIDNHRQSFKMTLRGKTHTDVDFLLSNTNCWCLRLNDYFNPSSPNGMGCKKHTDNKLQIVSVLPSLNTQSCIKGLLAVQDFCFWAI